MRPNGDLVYWVELHPDEQDFADVLKQQAGLTSDSDLLRLGLWHLAKHLDVPIGNEIFGIAKPRTYSPEKQQQRRQRHESLGVYRARRHG